VAAARTAAGPVVYAVPGDPAVGETSVGLLRSAAEHASLRLKVLPGVSFIGPTLAALGWDALDGVQVADATVMAAMHHPPLDPDQPALVAQVYGRMLASDLKLVLLNQYPDDHPVTLVSGAAGLAPRQVTMPLAELDHRDEDFDDWSTLAVPPLPRPGSLQRLAEVIAHLRAPDGCPWDREQTHASLRPYMIEEAYEAVAAIDDDDTDSLAEELGDVLLQVVLHAQIAVEEGSFALADVVGHITDKLVRRHPHVFGEVVADTAEEVLRNWDRLKADERRVKGVDEPEDPLSGVPPQLPALMRAQQVQRKARSVGVDALERADETSVMLDALAVSLDALRDVAGAATPLAHGNDATQSDGLDERTFAQEEEEARRGAAVGDALWVLATLARAWGVDAEGALRAATAGFEARVRTAVNLPRQELAGD
jgi:tetrapyrrole methylase family protein/MazG family protein